MEKDTEGYSQLPKSYLKREWFFFTFISLKFIIGGYAILSLAWDQVNALHWMILTIGGTAALTLSLWRDLEHNHRTEEIDLLPTLGLANGVTLVRGLLLAGLAGFLFSPVPTGWLRWIPALLYTIAATSDYLDGYLARISNQTTALGERMDMRLDGAGVLIAAVLAVQYQQVPGFYLLVGLSRYLFTGGIWLLNRRNKPVYPLPSSFSRRAMAGLQMGFLAVILLPLFSPPGTYLAATLIGIPFLVNFLVDWLYVSGALKPGIAVPSRWRSLTARYLPIIPRVLTALFLLVPILNNSLKPLLEPISGVTMYLQVLITILLLLGVAARTAASGQPGAYQFAIQISSPDLGCEQYADWWEVIDEAGNLIYRRILTHSHVDEQPFTRSGGPIAINQNDVVIERAHMHPGGYSDTAFKGTVADGFQVIQLDPGYAGKLENALPLPDHCAF